MANWYAYNDFEDPMLPGSYYLVDTIPNCVLGGCKLCAIYLDQSASVPAVLPRSVRVYIANALISLVPQPSEGDLQFVYVKSC